MLIEGIIKKNTEEEDREKKKRMKDKVNAVDKMIKKLPEEVLGGDKVSVDNFKNVDFLEDERKKIEGEELFF